MTEFNGATGATATDPQPAPAEPVDTGGVSMLDRLRQSVADAAAVREDWVHEIKRTGVRLTCDANISAEDFQRWQRAAMPRQPGRRNQVRVPDPTTMRREVLSARAIIATCMQIEIKGDGDTWSVLLNPASKEPMVLDDQELLRSFGVPDPIEMVRKLFVRDSDLLNAGEELLDAAGFMGEDDDESDPT